MTTPSLLRPLSLGGSSQKFVVDNMPEAEIRPSRVHGNGLFATCAFDAGAVLGELDGQLVDWTSYEAARRTGAFAADADDLFMEWNAVSTEALLIRPFRTKYSFINHSRAPNAELLHEPLRVVVSRAVAAGEEITLDYRREPLRREYLERATYL